MFEELTLHGPRATLLWGYREVAGLRLWRITMGRPWTLTATVDRADRWQCRQASTCRELLFTAPRAKGRSCWPVLDVSLSTTELRATLGQPLQ